MTRTRRQRPERGQAMAEFALVAPFFFLLLFGIIQLGILFADQNGLVNGVRDSARRAATYRINQASFDGSVTYAGICQAVSDELKNRLSHEMPGFQPARLTSTIGYGWQQDPTDGQYFLVATVRGSYADPLFVPLVGNIINPSNPGSITLSASEQMRVENPPILLSSTPSNPPPCP